MLSVAEIGREIQLVHERALEKKERAEAMREIGH